ncbi:LppX_LprAFG lipoprotein [Actinomadura flavalba]|uniref:LppX_LprAFG lipoprotein n=1 Tax=Actinomadura flavalba TaxID=1120938 RepID=UPI001F0A5E70|nr:LppX_LprAFG lipoprotein [Actinomadura flavalba]
MRRRWMMTAGGTTLGAALVLSGCNAEVENAAGGNAVKMSATEALVKTSQQTRKADAFKAALTVTDAGDGGTLKGTGQFRLRPNLEFTAQLDEYSRGGQAMTGVTGRALFTGDTLYAKVPQLARFVAGGKPWLEVNVNEISQRTGFDVQSLLQQVRTIDPAEQTKMFTASKDVRRVGTETVDGVKTTRYAGTVTVQEALKQLDPEARQNARRHLPNDGKVAFDLWTGGDNLPRKLVAKSTGTEGGNGTVEVRYSDYGKPFTVNRPPSDQVGKLSLDGLFNAQPRN